MPTGLALTIGLNSVTPSHYDGWSGELTACEADARDMAQLAKSTGFTVTTLLTKQATRAQVVSKIASAAKTLQAGDMFMLSYSGHGGQLPDLNHDEEDGQDETWCLYDGQLVDDELYAELKKFAKGVRVLVFSDSCHSGTVVKAAHYGRVLTTPDSNANTQGIKYRFMPFAISGRTYRQHQDSYDKILAKKDLKDSRAKVKASVLLISGCQDNQYSADGQFNGLFTGTLLQVWNHGKFKGNYKTFHQAIVRRMPPDQTPKYFGIGSFGIFDTQKSFSI